MMIINRTIRQYYNSVIAFILGCCFFLFDTDMMALNSFECGVCWNLWTIMYGNTRHLAGIFLLGSIKWVAESGFRIKVISAS